LPKRVVIIGGGFSGLAAGVALSDLGHEVLLLERRNHLGGRAYSFTDAKTGDQVDNGQHLFMQCYHETVAFLDKIGCLHKLKFQNRPRIDFLDRRGWDAFECPPLPSPLHVLAGLLRMDGLSIGDKLRALRVGHALRSRDQNHLTVAQWFDRLGQSDNIRRRFWYPMAIATLNEKPEVASALMMKVVLLEAFDGDRAGGNIGISRVALSDLYTEGARSFIEARGGQVRTGSQVNRLIEERGRIGSVEMKDGTPVEADFFISAVTHDALLQMLPADLRNGEFACLAALRSSPIVSINLWFDMPVTDREFVGLIGTRIQWLFNKDAILSNAQHSNHIAIIISAAREFVDWTREALVEMALEELNQLIPESRSAKLVHSAVVKERDATLAHTVESDRLRPGPRTSISNLILAGDWTATGLPATIESAVMSGHTAARIVHAEKGHTVR
jgi:squalene-associated FAD-dependent desaturase